MAPAPVAFAPVASSGRMYCDPQSAHDWRFNIGSTSGLTRRRTIVNTECQGNVIRRGMYTTTGRQREFVLCRRHQVEIGSMAKAVVSS